MCVFDLNFDVKILYNLLMEVCGESSFFEFNVFEKKIINIGKKIKNELY